MTIRKSFFNNLKFYEENIWEYNTTLKGNQCHSINFQKAQEVTL